MPTLDWIGKRAVLNHHREVPYHLLKCDGKLSVGDPGSGNLLVQGDNLLALKALLPYYAGKVKCIYIDPPYNTGNEGWVYNDATNSPEMKAWLGKVVGKEAEDLSRHDKWLCMMYPRISLLREFLTQDGAIFVSLDDNEAPHFRLLMDEVFGTRNFIASVIWQKVYSPKNSARHFSEDHDYVVVYAREANRWVPNPAARTEKQDRAYKNPDSDPRGPWKTSDLSARNFYSRGTYSITTPSGRLIEGPPVGMYWRVSEESFKKLDADNRIWWGKKGDAIPQIKRFLSEVKDGRVPQTLWFYDEVGHTQEAKQELLEIVEFPDSASVFITPKPTGLLRKILELASEEDSLVLDSFAGSGTTGHAVLGLNRLDGGTRRFVLVEIDEKICQDIARERVKRVSEGFAPVGGGEPVPGLGGGFRFCKLGPPLFDADGAFSGEVKFNDLAAHIWFTETGEPLPKRVQGTPLLGAFKTAGAADNEPGTALYLLFNGVLGDRRSQGGNVLTADTLAALPKHDGPRIVYGEGCRLGAERLKRAGVTFKQIPYQVRGV